MRVATKRIHATRIKLLFSRMSLSQNRCALLGDMLQVSEPVKRWMRVQASSSSSSDVA